MNIWFTVVGWGASAALFFMWLDGREDLAASIANCNVEKLAAVAEAEQQTRLIIESRNAERIAEIERLLGRERRAREIAEEARARAEANPVEVVRVVRETAGADPESCLNQSVPGHIIDRLRD